MIGFASCQCSSDELINNDWVLESYSNEGAVVRLLDGVPFPPPGTGVITLSFANGQITGNDGCNNYFGDYSVDNCNFSVGQLNSTLIQCTANINNQAIQYGAILSNVNTFHITNNQLSLSTPDNRVLIFSKQ
ncbi:MAG: META domain-containing protein [Bacteroidota bacterium]